MALREGSRRWLLRLSWAGLIASLAAFFGLWLGRPLYYTDGQQQVRADELQHDGMLRWGAPEVVAELPGRVTGRVAELPDGRLCYGQLTDDGTSDLVVFDPRRPDAAPEPAYGLNSAHNELAPAVLPDGSVWFTSDRPGGRGGYDLYTSRYERGGFAPPAPFEPANTALDETDPAPSPDGTTLVFVRIDVERRGPDDGRLFRLALGGELDAVPLFDEPFGARQARRADRDPAFAADGAELWFVRKLLGQPAQLQRCSVHQGRWDEERLAAAHWGLGAVRAPLPARDGVRLFVLQPPQADEHGALWYVSHAQELHPYRLAQRWLEWLLLGAALTCALLLVLLHLGRRWTALDLLAQCLLLSLLVHVLLFLWLMGVQITGTLLEGDDGGSSLQVSIVASSDAAERAGGDGQVQHDVAAMAEFTVRDRAIEAAAPGAELQGERARLDGPAERPLDAPAASAATAEAAARADAPSLQDAAAAAPLRDGEAVAEPVAASVLPTVGSDERAAATAAAAQRAVDGRLDAPVVVTSPGVALGAVPAAAAASLASAPTPRGVPQPRTVAVDAREVSDSRQAEHAAAPLRAGVAEQDVVAPAPTASVSGPTNAVAGAAIRATREPAAPAGHEVEVATPQASLGAVAGTRHDAPQAALRALPAATSTRSAPAVAALRDAGASTNAAAAAPPAPPAPPAVARAELPAVAAPAEVLAVRAAPSPRHGELPSATATVPSSLLGAAGADLARAASSTLHAPQPARNQVVRGAPLLRDGPRRSPLPVAAAAPAGAVTDEVRSAQLPRLDGPTAAATVAPVRSGAPTLGLGSSASVRPPGSLWDRLPLQPLAMAAELRDQNAYSNRFGPAKAAALEQFGGNADTERAVRDGLRYLARIQNRDGSWGDRRRFDDKYGLVYIGKSALCLLAFLGAGHTPTSKTEHSDVVARSLEHLLSVQDTTTGAFGPSSCYGHGIATYALAECYGLTKDKALLRPLEDALVWILTHQGPRQDRRNRGGWGYFSPGLGAEDNYARVSVTSWMVMALESARLSGIELPKDALPAAREYLELSFDEPNGWFRYNHNPSRLRSQWPTLPASTPAGAFCLMLVGVDKDDARVATAVDYTVQRRPQEYRRYDDDDFVLGGQGNVYFWYYGSLACFLRGGEAWAQWNERLKTVLPAGQAEDGSWAPIDPYARYAGDSDRDRSYTTAMCVLSLEVYYRYFTPLLIGR